MALQESYTIKQEHQCVAAAPARSNGTIEEKVELASVLQAASTKSSAPPYTRALDIAATHHCVKRLYRISHNDQARTSGENRRGSHILQPAGATASSQPE